MWYDIFVLAILIVGMVRGAVRGVVWQLAGIAGIVLCLVFAETISHIGSPLVNLEPPLNQWVVMFVAYLFFSFLSFGFARLIHSALEKAELKEYNKHLGAIFGLVKGGALCLVITFFLVTLSATTREWLQSSRSARYAAIVMDRLHPVMPEKLRGALDKYIHDLDASDLDLHYADGDHDHSGAGEEPWIPPTDGQTSTPDGTSGTGHPPATPTTAEAIDQLLQQIPGLANDSWTRQTARIVYEATPPESRTRLLEELRTAGPAMLFAVLQRWQTQPRPPADPAANGSAAADPGGDWSTTGSTQNVGYSQPPAPTRAKLVATISNQLARTAQERPPYEQYISERLQGLPDAVVVAVLQDWQADLTSGSTDPDPGTNGSTPLDQRIIRQLTIQRVSVYQLSQELQTRLMQARKQ